MPRLGRAYAARPRFGRKALRPYDAPPFAGPYGAAVIVNDNSDGGTAWDISSYALFSEGHFGGPVSLTIADNSPSQYLVLTAFNTLIQAIHAIAGIEFLTSFVSPVNVPTLTYRLIRNGVIQTPTRTIAAFTAGVDAVAIGGPLDTWDAPWTPAEINSSNFGVAIRKEGSENCDFTINYIATAVDIDTSGLEYATYSAGTYTFGPTPIAVDATTILFYLDATLHTVDTISARLIVEISYNSGADWSGLMDSGVNVGGTFSRESGITEPRWWSRMGLLDPENADRQFKGSLIIAGGSLTTSVGVFTTIE